MKKIIYPAITLALCITNTFDVHAQSAVDALQLTQNDFKGTARYMSMGGAFTALGGDLSAIGLNPGGIGVYRSSEIAATLDIDFQKSKGKSPGITSTNTQTKAYCNNFGYVGTAILKGALQTFSWGVTYNRAVSFDRVMSGRAATVNTSLTNYIAAYTQGVPADNLLFGEKDSYNPYFDSNYDWLSILAYNSYLINTVNGSPSTYQGLFGQGTVSDAEMSIQEKGYIDNYQFTFGGNVSNFLYWGLAIGINDLRYVRNAYFSESMDGAMVYADNKSGYTTGKAEYGLYNDKLVTGTGWNLSFGVIVKPVQALRIGASIKSPTWYKLDESYIGSVDYFMAPDRGNPFSGTEYTDEAYFSWKLRSPWRFNIGAALVLGTKAIVSADYEVQAYNDMTMQRAFYDNYGYISGFEDAEELNEDIRNYTQAASNVRLGFEYRVTPKLSARIGYNLQLSNIKNEYSNGAKEILTSGTDPSFSLDKTTNYISAGLGYKFGNFYADATYMHKTATSTMHPYTSYGTVDAPYFDVTQNDNSVILSVGFKF